MSDGALRFLADESRDFGVVKGLRADGYDVVALAEISSHIIDSDVIALSYSEKHILLTEDKGLWTTGFRKPGRFSRSHFNPLPRQCKEIVTRGHY